MLSTGIRTIATPFISFVHLSPFLCMQYRNQIQREPRIHSDCDPVVQKSINFGYHMLSCSWDSRSRMSRQGMLKEGKMFC